MNPTDRDAIEDRLIAESGAVPCRLFGTTGYLLRERLIGFWQGDDLVVKPPPEARARLLADKNATEFEIQPGRPFGRWIRLAPAILLAEPDLLAACRDHVLAEPPRTRRRLARGFRRA